MIGRDLKYLTNKNKSLQRSVQFLSYLFFLDVDFKSLFHILYSVDIDSNTFDMLSVRREINNIQYVFVILLQVRRFPTSMAAKF